MPVVLYFSVVKHNIQVFVLEYLILKVHLQVLQKSFGGNCWLSQTNVFLKICHIANQKSLLCYFCSEEVPSQSRLFRLSV